MCANGRGENTVIRFVSDWCEIKFSPNATFFVFATIRARMRPAHISRHYVKHKNFFFSCLQRNVAQWRDNKKSLRAPRRRRDFYFLNGPPNFVQRFIDSRNSSLLLECIICFFMNSMASSGFISARWLRRMNMRCRVSLSSNNSSRRVLDLVRSMDG